MPTTKNRKKPYLKLSVRRVFQHKEEPITTPHNMQRLQTHTEAKKVWGIWRPCTPLGAYKYTGGVQIYGGVQTPPSMNMPATKKNRKNPYLKLNSYT